MKKRNGRIIEEMDTFENFDFTASCYPLFSISVRPKKYCRNTAGAGSLEESTVKLTKTAFIRSWAFHLFVCNNLTYLAKHIHAHKI
jgi:hypothetical protein